jgi:hypothetical protein
MMTLSAARVQMSETAAEGKRAKGESQRDKTKNGQSNRPDQTH